MATTPPSINQFTGAVPQRGDRTTFSARVDAFVTWLIAMVVQLPALALNVYNNAVEAFQNATAATNAAAAAMATANVVLWASGTTYQQYAAVISPANGRTYRRTAAAGSGTTDPSLDTANYVQLSGFQGSTVLLASATVSSAVVNIDFLTAFSAIYDKIIVEIEDVVAPASTVLCLRLATGGSVDSTAKYLLNGTTGASTAVQLNGTLCQSGDVYNFTMEIRNANSTRRKGVGIRGMYVDPSLNNTGTTQEHGYSGTTAVTGLRLYWANGGNFTTGTVRIYGVSNT